MFKKGIYVIINSQDEFWEEFTLTILTITVHSVDSKKTKVVLCSIS